MSVLAGGECCVGRVGEIRTRLLSFCGVLGGGGWRWEVGGWRAEGGSALWHLLALGWLLGWRPKLRARVSYSAFRFMNRTLRRAYGSEELGSIGGICRGFVRVSGCDELWQPVDNGHICVGEKSLEKSINTTSKV